MTEGKSLLYDWQQKIIDEALEDYKKSHLPITKSIDITKRKLDSVMQSDVILVKNAEEYHIISLEADHHICPICRSRKADSKHHIIPQRINIDNDLRKLTIKICKKCHEDIHPENAYIEAFHRVIPIVEDMCGKEIRQIPTWSKIVELAKERWNGNHIGKLKGMEGNLNDA